MTTDTIILLGLAAFALARARSSDLAGPTWLRHLEGRQKILGGVAAVMAVLIFLNPELLALGLLEDAAFVDIVVLALSWQMHVVLSRVLRAPLDVLSRVERWLGIPSPGLACLLTFSAVAIGCAASELQRIVHRMLA